MKLSNKKQTNTKLKKLSISIFFNLSNYNFVTKSPNHTAANPKMTLAPIYSRAMALF